MTCPLPPNPRRGYKTKVAPTLSTLLPSTTHDDQLQIYIPLGLDRSLKKSATFHSPKSPSSDDDPRLNIPLLSKRSPTSPRDLEDAIAAGEHRIHQLLGCVDRSLSGLQSFSSDSQETPRGNDLPVPRFMLGAHVRDPDHMDIDNLVDEPPKKLQQHRKHHSSDSGIGSTVTDSEESPLQDDAVDQLVDYKKSIPSLINEVQSGINGASSAATQSGAQHALSAYACRQIQKYLIVPILKEEALKDFHPLVNGIPLRVGRREITCLRDLEKVLLWLAPRYSLSRALFLDFCETSIQCLHTTVEHLNESDQRRPTDRPYTNGYFLDLTEQIRQYAAMITAARERVAAGKAEEGDEQLANNKLSLEGGLGQTGRPAELVRTDDNGSVSMRTGEPVQLGLDTADEAYGNEAGEQLALSMARRRKAEAAVKEVQRCRECDKEFKRPCDLTKHEKTHSRPWKCDESSCKYSKYGWPTEKERDRHVNDKHSASPSMYRCQFHPCPYESKRESNCKQHMEKAHGWAYVRSKNNGKTGRKPSKSAQKSPPTPQMTTPGSHIFDASGSEFGDSTTSPYAQTTSVGHSTTTESIVGTSPALNLPDTFSPSPFEPNYNWDQQPFPVLTPESPYPPASHHFSVGSESATDAQALPSTYETSMSDIDMPLFNGTFDWSNMDTDFQTMNIQLVTPASSIDGRPFDAYHGRHPSVTMDQPILTTNSKLSPGAQGGIMLYTPEDHVPGTFDDFTTEMGRPTGDFELFGSRQPSCLDSTGGMNLFQELPPFTSTTWMGNPTDLHQNYVVDENVMMEE